MIKSKLKYFKSKLSDALLVSIITFIVLLFFYGRVILSPNSYLLCNSGDGLKTYFVYQYHIDNDSTYNNTSAINYPYGEIHIFTDGETLFANTFKILKSVLPSLAEYSIGFLNLLMILSSCICAVFLFLILRKFEVSKITSMAGSVLISMLSPQLLRYLGHPSLSYTFIIPMIWYFQLQFFENSNWKNTLKIFLLLFLSPFIHTYYILICGLFLFLNWTIYLLLKKNIRLFVKSLQHIVVQTALPILLFQAYVSLIDNHIDRSDEPLGLLNYTTSFSSIFTPNQGPFKPFFNSLSNLSDEQWEGFSYIGTAVLLLLLVSIIIHVLSKLRITGIAPSKLPIPLKCAIIASLIILVYSFGYPFKWNLSFVNNYLFLLKQFRALGRFSWVFYYVISVYAVWFIHSLQKYFYAEKKKYLYYAICSVFISIQGIEAFTYHKFLSEKIGNKSNQFNHDLLDINYKNALGAIISNKYQAIIPLPYFHVGSESQTRVAPDSTMKAAMLLSYYSRIPLLASSSARCSMKESKKLMQLFGPSYIYKVAQNDFNSHKPFLVLYAKDELLEDEHALLEKSKKIFSNDHLELYELEFDDLFVNTELEEIRKFENRRDSLFTNGEFLTTNNSNEIYYDDFEELKSDTALLSNGAKKGKIKDYLTLLESRKFEPKVGIEYIASFWHYNKGTFINSGMAIVEQVNSFGHENKWIANSNLSTSANIVEDWSLIELKFTLKEKGNSISIFTHGDEKIEKITYRDNLLIRPANVDVYKIIVEKNGKIEKLFFNNYLLEANLNQSK